MSPQPPNGLVETSLSLFFSLELDRQISDLPGQGVILDLLLVDLRLRASELITGMSCLLIQFSSLIFLAGELFGKALGRLVLIDQAADNDHEVHVHHAFSLSGLDQATEPPDPINDID